MANSDRNNNKTAIISGGARGIGRCLVRRFLEKGYRVFVFDIDEEELKHTTHVHLKKYTDSKALGSAICNLRDVEDIRKQVKQAAEFLDGEIHVLINNGGIAAPKWKDEKTMFDMDTIGEWQAWVTYSTLVIAAGTDPEQICRNQPHGPLCRQPGLSALHEERRRERTYQQSRRRRQRCRSCKSFQLLHFLSPPLSSSSASSISAHSERTNRTRTKKATPPPKQVSSV